MTTTFATRFRLDGKVALVTAAAGGFGAQICRGLAEQGADVVVTDVNDEAAIDVAKTIDELGRRSLAAHLDVADAAAIARVIPQIISDHPALNVIINNAGIMFTDDPTEPIDDERLTTIVATNLLGPVRVNSAVITHLKSLPSAAIVNVSSMLGFVPLASSTLYSATKAALHSYTHSLRYRLEETTVEVFEIAPPYTQTDLMTINAHDPRAMPLSEFLAETMAAWENNDAEILVVRARARADALRPGELQATTQMNDMMTGK